MWFITANSDNDTVNAFEWSGWIENVNLTLIIKYWAMGVKFVWKNGTVCVM